MFQRVKKKSIRLKAEMQNFWNDAHLHYMGFMFETLLYITCDLCLKQEPFKKGKGDRNRSSGVHKVGTV